ncbi:MAG: hypothetical protein Q8J72_12735 [Rhodocyclaceae bacterium]|nr:hypothetical protein [Rhodocyclaceae bacterium]
MTAKTLPHTVPPAPTSDQAIDQLDLETCRKIREALLIGLSSFGEIERLDNAYDIHVNIGREQIPDDLRPIHPTGAADTISNFADALRAIDTLEWIVENNQKSTEGVTA